ncbi:DNA-3-methyladenine glycosylase [Starkeya sp. ORNL1]|uniref:DNA-3-methyladenine glycosylase n=1 Tax=Starkeya sp. ORNL1 TaxID=2709380 RepID=UPI00146325C7|nr:DNA-3-methyladenine glycosylase [Starkeya sp. ORNL1]QJP12606.1 DNA-3-methyladenine glycosylase [Starkeya sp. ORNL1]
MSIFAANALELAPRLIGTKLLVDGVGGTIVETEAYRPDDPASHSFRGLTKTNTALFGPLGHAYVYRSHGLHWCFNVVAEQHGGVLVRALAPEFGIDQMIARRGVMTGLCSGPGRLTQALGINASHDGLPLDKPPFEFVDRLDEPDIISGPRIGLTKAVTEPWRFGLAGSPYLSKPFSKRPASVGPV